MHKFVNNCVQGGFETLLAKPKLKNFVDAAFKQSKTDEAYKLWDLKQYYDKFVHNDDPVEDGFCQVYFGSCGDWFLTEYMNYFGEKHNVSDVQSLLDDKSSEKDIGIDAHGKSCRPGKTRDVTWGAGSPVEIQFKFSSNPIKELELNSSRLGNFFGAVWSTSRRAKKVSSTRAIIVTTAADVNHNARATGGDEENLEVIGFRTIAKNVEGHMDFWNHLRKIAGLPGLKAKEIFDEVEEF